MLVAPLALVSSARSQESAPPPPVPPVPNVSPAFAGESEISVEALIERALQNSPQLPIARENLEAARQRAAGARVLLNPTLQAVPRLLGNQTAADTEIIVSQPLDIFGRRRAGAAVFAAQLRGAQAANLLAERTLVVQVKNAAADLFAAQEAENLGVSQSEVAVLFRDAAARRAELGDVPAVQVQRAELELLRVQNELTGARAERLARRATLNQIIGQAPETPLRVALPLSSDFAAVLQVPTISRPGFSPNLSTESAGGTPNAPTAGGSLGGNAPGTANSGIPSVPLAPNAAPAESGDLGTSGGSNAPILGSSSQIGSDLVAQRAALLPGALGRPDIVGAQSTVEARQAQVRAIARGRYPDIEVQVRRGSFFGQGDSSTALRAVVTVPLFDFGSISREKKAAQAEVRASQAQLALLRQQAATQVEQALIRLGQQRQTVETYRSGIVPQTLDLLRKTQVGYAQGASTYLEVLDAQRTLRAVQTEYLQALVGTRTSEAALESALGAAPPAGLTGSLLNPSGAAALPGTAPIGTVSQGTIPPNPTAPLNPPSSNLPGTNAPLGQGTLPGTNNPVPAPR
ncbi:TolC family protein [Abditibacterium utsteinense]|uniref:TolC family protein n=1 Tax=Abditibacterium utsteinense TaxID=1960156 RepID=UPI0014739EC4|nr:TolC family protein [Abditibacterium utsteinense]